MTRTVGQPVPRVDAKAKAMGEAVYTADITLPRMLHGKILRSPHAHAKIIRIDTTEASRLSGVEAVVTAKDLPDVRDGEFLHDQTAFAVGKVHCMGEPIAAVAAVDPHRAPRISLRDARCAAGVAVPQLHTKRCRRVNPVALQCPEVAQAPVAKGAVQARCSRQIRSPRLIAV